MKQIAIIVLLGTLLFSFDLKAQNSIEQILQRTEEANKELQAQRELNKAQKTEAKTGNSLNNPTVEYENMWRGAPKAMSGELTISQPFDFPSVYAARNGLSKLKATQYDHETAAFRQNLLLQSKLICLDIIYLRQRQALIDQRVENAKQMSEVYRKKMEAGSANILEINKINMELISMQTESDVNRASLNSMLEQLSNMLGGEPIEFTTMTYPANVPLPALSELETIYTENSYELKSILSEIEVNRQNVAVSKALGLPKMELGYRHDFGAEGRFSGVKVGVSIPMFENRNKVKAAKAMNVFSEARLNSARQTTTSVLRELYNKATALKRSCEAMQNVFASHNSMEILGKALNEGQISVIEYFTEVSSLFANQDTLLQTERDYQYTTAQIFKFEL